MTISSTAIAAVYNVTLGSTSAAAAFGVGSGVQSFTGTGSWFKAFPPGPKFETYIPVASLGTSFTVNDIASINYHTNNPVVNPSGVDFFMVLYTAPFVGGDASWYGRRLTAEPYLMNGYVAPTLNTWNTWNSASGPNQMTFNDSNHSGNQGFYNAPTLADLQAGTINWATWPGNPSGGSATGGAINYGTQPVNLISFQTGSGWASVSSYLDAIQVNLKNGNTYNINLENVADDQASPQSPTSCITPAHTCVAVPVNIARTNSTPMRGYSVNLQLSANLALCSPNISEGVNTYLNSIGSTSFLVTNNGGGSYTVDCAILGGATGATGPGTLFTVNVTSASPSGTGTVTITSVIARDLVNGPILVLPGAPASVTIQNTAPASISDLAATQVLTGNGSGSTTGINLSWATGGAGSVSVYRAPFGSYPEYDDDGSVTAPNPAAAPGAPWTLVSSSATSPFVDNGTAFFQGFEVDNSQWNVLPGQYTAPRVASGTHGVTSRTGGFHAEAGQFNLDVDGGSAFTRWGGYRSVFPTGGWTTQVSVYLDCALAAGAGDKRIDFSSAVNDPSGNFHRDFVFNMGTEPTGFVISAGNNAGRSGANPANPGHAPVHVTITGWYTLRHTFYNNAGVLACDLQLLSPANTVISTWTLSDPSDLIGVTVGGNRYGWFAAQELPFLAIDDSKLLISFPRGFWHYVAIVTDACGNNSAVSNMTGGTLNYLLGDVTPSLGAGDNKVDGLDISALGFNYGVSGEALVDAVGYLDVGPTVTGAANSRPKPDDKLNFEDLIIYAINYGTPGAQVVATREGPVADADAITVSGPSTVSGGSTFTVELRMKGAGDIQGVSSQLAWDARVATPVSVHAGDLLTAANGVAFSARPGNVDAALLGARSQGLTGEGVLAAVTFRALTSGDPKISVAHVEARDAANRALTLNGTSSGTTMPTETKLFPVTPNPFSKQAVLRFSLAKAGPVGLAIYSVDGRRVNTIVDGIRPAGLHSVSWNGADSHGSPVRAGVYYAKLRVGGREFTSRLVYVK